MTVRQSARLERFRSAALTTAQRALRANFPTRAIQFALNAPPTRTEKASTAILSPSAWHARTARRPRPQGRPTHPRAGACRVSTAPPVVRTAQLALAALSQATTAQRSAALARPASSTLWRARRPRRLAETATPVTSPRRAEQASPLAKPGRSQLAARTTALHVSLAKCQTNLQHRADRQSRATALRR